MVSQRALRSFDLQLNLSSFTEKDLALKSAMRERQGDLENLSYLSKNPRYSLVV